MTGAARNPYGERMDVSNPPGHWPRCRGTGAKIDTQAGVATCPVCGRNNVAVNRHRKLVAHKPKAVSLDGPIAGVRMEATIVDDPMPAVPRLSSQQARMLLSISTHGDPLAHCRTQSDHGGAHGTLTSLHRHGLATFVREARKGAPSTLVLTELGRRALADHQRRNGGAELALSAAPAAAGSRRRGAREVGQHLTQGEARAAADRLVRRYLRARSAETAARDFGRHERDLVAWVTLALFKASKGERP